MSKLSKQLKMRITLIVLKQKMESLNTQFVSSWILSQFKVNFIAFAIYICIFNDKSAKFLVASTKTPQYVTLLDDDGSALHHSKFSS